MRADRLDALALDLQHHVALGRVAGAVEQATGADVEGGRGCGEEKSEDEGHALKTSSSSTRPRPSPLQLMCRGARTTRCPNPRYRARMRGVAELESRKRTPRRSSAAHSAPSRSWSYQVNAFRV